MKFRRRLSCCSRGGGPCGGPPRCRRRPRAGTRRRSSGLPPNTFPGNRLEGHRPPAPKEDVKGFHYAIERKGKYEKLDAKVTYLASP